DYVKALDGALQNRRGKLIVFMGNEFNVPWMPFEQRRAWLRSVAADIVATQLLKGTADWLYEGSGARVLS
ncbi:hypothetical protein, partial [Enterobacter hormaechei]